MAPSKAFIIIYILNINRCFFIFFIFSGNGRYEDPLSGSYLVTSFSCLSTDLISHPLPYDIQSLIRLISSLLASLVTVSISFSLIISRALYLKKPLFTFSICFIEVIFNVQFIFIPCFLFNSSIRNPWLILLIDTVVLADLYHLLYQH